MQLRDRHTVKCPFSMFLMSPRLHSQLQMKYTQYLSVCYAGSFLDFIFIFPNNNTLSENKYALTFQTSSPHFHWKVCLPIPSHRCLEKWNELKARSRWNYWLNEISQQVNKIKVIVQLQTKMTWLPMCGFIAQLVEHRTGISRRSWVGIPLKPWIFSGFFSPIV